MTSFAIITGALIPAKMCTNQPGKVYHQIRTYGATAEPVVRGTADSLRDFMLSHFVGIASTERFTPMVRDTLDSITKAVCEGIVKFEVLQPVVASEANFHYLGTFIDAQGTREEVYYLQGNLVPKGMTLCTVDKLETLLSPAQWEQRINSDELTYRQQLMRFVQTAYDFKGWH